MVLDVDNEALITPLFRCDEHREISLIVAVVFGDVVRHSAGLVLESADWNAESLEGPVRHFEQGQ